MKNKLDGATVTEAHRKLTLAITGHTDSFEYYAQLIADSEALACAELRAEVERLKSARYKYATDPEMVFTDDLGWVHEFVIGEFDDLKARAERAEAKLKSLVDRF